MPVNGSGAHADAVNTRALSGSLACLVLCGDALLLGYALTVALRTHEEVARSGPDSFASFGYLFAAMAAGVAVPSLVLAITALLTRGAAAVACSILSVISLAACAMFAVNYV